MVEVVSAIEVSQKVNKKLNRARKRASLVLFRLGQL